MYFSLLKIQAILLTYYKYFGIEADYNTFFRCNIPKFIIVLFRLFILKIVRMLL